MSRIKAPELVEKAANAASAAYSPYSGFRVGAALLAADGRVFHGCNIENASYGLTICAERAAVAAAVSAGCRTFAAMAIVADGAQMPYPCGACRQVLSEFCGPDFQVHVSRLAQPGHVETYRLRTLLPKQFSLGTRKSRRGAPLRAARKPARL